jgi:uncharacterized membrane protein YphA (DoxX/SURF4 family)
MELTTLGITGAVIYAIYFMMEGMLTWARTAAIGQDDDEATPRPGFMAFFSGFLYFIGGLTILLGVLGTKAFSWQIDFGAWIIILTLFFSAFWRYPFWRNDNTQINMANMARFLRNWALIGAALMLL